MSIESFKIDAHPLRRLSSTDATSTTFTAKAPTTTKPSGDYVIDTRDDNLGLVPENSPFVPEWMACIPYGSDANNEDFHLRVYGWSEGASTDTTLKDAWFPVLLTELVVTLGNIDASTPLGTNYFLADTITETTGDSENDGLTEVCSPGSDRTASFYVHTRGFRLIEFDFDVDAGSSAATNANVLWRFFSGASS